MTVTYRTLSRQDQDFSAYILGTFSEVERALPVPSLGQIESSQQMTFCVLPTSELRSPSALIVLSKAWRPQLLSLTLGPMIVTAAYLWSQGFSMTWGALGLALLSVWFLHGAVFMFNDFSDHVRGVDRRGKNSGSQVIQRGWVPAYQLRRWAMVSAAVGALIGVPLIISQPRFLLLAGLGAAVGVLGYSFKGRGLKYVGLGEITVFFCLGPLLTYGVARVAGEVQAFEVLYLGTLFGFMAAWVLLTRQFVHLMNDGQLNVKTFLVRLGFDRARGVLIAILALVTLLYAGGFWLSPIDYKHFILTLPVWWLVILTTQALAASRSPVSSSIRQLKIYGLALHIAVSVTLTILFLLP